MRKFLKKSPRTTAAGIIVVLSALIPQLEKLTDDDPQTKPDWRIVIPLIATGIGFMLSSDEK